MNRLLRFYYRFRNQWRIHKHLIPLREIIKMAWIQSRQRTKNKAIITRIDVETLKESLKKEL